MYFHTLLTGLSNYGSGPRQRSAGTNSPTLLTFCISVPKSFASYTRRVGEIRQPWTKMSVALFSGLYFGGALAGAAGLYRAGAFEEGSKIPNGLAFGVSVVFVILALWSIVFPNTPKLGTLGRVVLLGVAGICTPILVLYANAGAEEEEGTSPPQRSGILEHTPL